MKKNPRAVGDAGPALAQALSPRELHALMTVLKNTRPRTSRYEILCAHGWRQTQGSTRCQGDPRLLVRHVLVTGVASGASVITHGFN